MKSLYRCLALEMRVKKKEFAESESELAKTMEAVAKLQKRLQDAEKLLVRGMIDTYTLLLLIHYRKVVYIKPKSC